jgi:hypothetical protein
VRARLPRALHAAHTRVDAIHVQLMRSSRVSHVRICLPTSSSRLVLGCLCPSCTPARAFGAIS